MKGYTDEKENDKPPCYRCKHRHKMTIELPCWDCIDIIDIATHKPNAKTEFMSFELDIRGDNK